MENISIIINSIFMATTGLSILLLYKASQQSKPLLIFILFWISLQTILGLSGFYENSSAIPPRLMFVLAPLTLFIIFMFTTDNGKKYMDQFDIKSLTLLHLVRIPVEITLFYLFKVGLVPKLMTFEGFNFDILSGMTAPIVYYFVFMNPKVNQSVLLAWNLICLCLLIIIVSLAILSAPTPFQKLAFEQPNIGVFQFPYIWLPSIIVPIVLFSHLVSLRQIIKRVQNP